MIFNLRCYLADIPEMQEEVEAGTDKDRAIEMAEAMVDAGTYGCVQVWDEEDLILEIESGDV